MTAWIESLFKTKKPAIAMAHIPALPGTPRYNEDGGVAYIVDTVQKDVATLVNGGVDAIMFCNEDDRPYVFQAGIEQIATMTRVVCECAPKDLPFGVDFLWDPKAAIAIAHASEGTFVREVFTGLYESDMGIWSPDAGEALRFRRQIGAQDIRLFYNVVPEFAISIGTRDLAQRAYSAVVSSLADAILISGPMAGAEPDLSHVEIIKNGVGDIPVMLNTGAKPNNIEGFLQVADGVIVGSSLKVDGYTWNPVDPKRVDAFMEIVRKTREG